MKPRSRIRKALIPVAGLGTRLFPATRVIPKPMLPVIDAGGQVIPLIHALIQEVVSAGIEHVGIIAAPEQRPLFEKYFYGDPDPELLQRAAEDTQIANFLSYLTDLSCRVEFITQQNPDGFGHAVYTAKYWVGGEPFLLLLGDHLYRSFRDITCCHQLLQGFYEKERSLVGITRMPVEEAPKRGTVSGDPYPDLPHRYDLNRIKEKPDPEYARLKMKSQGLPEDWVFCLFGCYAFMPEIFRVLENDVKENNRVRNEIQLTEAMEKLCHDFGCDGLELDGESMDIGNPEDYRNAFGFLYNPPEDVPETAAAG